MVHFTVHPGAFNHSINTQVGTSTILDDPENNYYRYAIHYDVDGQNVAYYDQSIANEGAGPLHNQQVDTEYGDNGNPDVGWIVNGEWLEYVVQFQETAECLMELRVASKADQL